MKIKSTKTLQEMNSAGGCIPTTCGTEQNTCSTFNNPSNEKISGTNRYSTINYTRDCNFGGVSKSCSYRANCPNLQTYKDGKCIQVGQTMCDESRVNSCETNGGEVRDMRAIPGGNTWTCWAQIPNEIRHENCIKCDTGYEESSDGKSCVKPQSSYTWECKDATIVPDQCEGTYQTKEFTICSYALLEKLKKKNLIEKPNNGEFPKVLGLMYSPGNPPCEIKRKKVSTTIDQVLGGATTFDPNNPRHSNDYLAIFLSRPMRISTIDGQIHSSIKAYYKAGTFYGNIHTVPRAIGRDYGEARYVRCNTDGIESTNGESTFCKNNIHYLPHAITVVSERIIDTPCVGSTEYSCEGPNSTYDNATCSFKKGNSEQYIGSCGGGSYTKSTNGSCGGENTSVTNGVCLQTYNGNHKAQPIDKNNCEKISGKWLPKYCEVATSKKECTDTKEFPGCIWTPPTSTTKSCSTLSSQSSCNSKRGCSWLYKYPACINEQTGEEVNKALCTGGQPDCKQGGNSHGGTPTYSCQAKNISSINGVPYTKINIYCNSLANQVRCQKPGYYSNGFDSYFCGISTSEINSLGGLFPYHTDCKVSDQKLCAWGGL